MVPSPSTAITPGHSKTFKFLPLRPLFLGWVYNQKPIVKMHSGGNVVNHPLFKGYILITQSWYQCLMVMVLLAVSSTVGAVWLHDSNSTCSLSGNRGVAG